MKGSVVSFRNRRKPRLGRGPYWACFFLSTVAASVSLGTDWPQWRGLNRDGTWYETGVVREFRSPRLAIKWRVDVGPGYSGPTVADGRVFVTDRVFKPDEGERVHCFNALDGRRLWSYAYECDYKRVGYQAGPRASVTVDEDRAYSLGTMGHLYCFEAATGRAIWARDLYKQYRIRMPIWGIAAAPLVYRDLVIVQIGGENNACLVALDKVRGDERWRALADPASYSAPVIIGQAGQPVLVCVTGVRVVGLDPGTGKLHWDSPYPPSRMTITIATPVYDGEHLFVSSFYDGSLLLNVDHDRLAVEELWRRQGPNERETQALHCCISTPILEGDHIYGVDSYGELRCLELETGNRVWENLTATPKARWSNIHMVRHGEETWMFNERGELIISRLSPKGFHEISRTKLIEPTTAQLSQRGGVCWSHPAFANRHVYARNDRELVCADLSER